MVAPRQINAADIAALFPGLSVVPSAPRASGYAVTDLAFAYAGSMRSHPGLGMLIDEPNLLQNNLMFDDLTPGGRGTLTYKGNGTLGWTQAKRYLLLKAPLPHPFFFQEVTINSWATAGAGQFPQSTAVLGFQKDANNYVQAYLNQVTNTVGIDYFIAGTNTGFGSTSYTPPTLPIRMGLSVHGPEVVVWVNEKNSDAPGSWRVLFQSKSPAALNLTSVVATYRPFFGAITDSDGAGELNLSRYKLRLSGGAGLRDPKPIKWDDGQPYLTRNNKLLFTATVAHPSISATGFQATYAGIFELDLSTFAVTSIGAVLHRASGTFQGNSPCSLIRRKSDGSWDVLASNFGAAPAFVDVVYKNLPWLNPYGYTYVDNAVAMNFGGGTVSCYDQDYINIGGTIYLVYVRNSGGLNFENVVRTGTSLSTLGAAVSLGSASSLFGEGPAIAKVGGSFSVVNSGVNAASYVALDLLTRANLGLVTAPRLSPQSHPPIVALPLPNGGTRYLMISMDLLPQGSATASNGGLQFYIADRAAGMEHDYVYP